MIPPHHNLALVLAILATLVLTSTAQTPRPALTKQAFRKLLKLRFLPTMSHPPPATSSPSPIFHPLIFIPGFQGTLLSQGSRPLFLTPITPSTYTQLYTILRTIPFLSPLSVEYPSSTCAPSPHSHICHCHPLPVLRSQPLSA
ncbi:unnamed protein product [Chondrus crispus]|uniref:Uncharacterized protein n=1 Tax=Chondrus crispus TaxID=2769 RepID=R7QHL4_CHOCR|nr:unnamed protein product [Chondrus crispus]CDF37982.1 unnamed protein product [Chondrus crispus]|eukprot:XP_005717851.1 unnamed protein product [Chondrus crispus]